MLTASLPKYFTPDTQLADFLLANDFTETTHESQACRMMGHRQFRHRHTQLYASIMPDSGSFVLENVHGWLMHYYKRLDTSALVYLLLRNPANEANKATYFLLADSSPYTLPA